MDRNVRIAKELVRLAKRLVADEASEQNAKEFKRLVKVWLKDIDDAMAKARKDGWGAINEIHDVFIAFKDSIEHFLSKDRQKGMESSLKEVEQYEYDLEHGSNPGKPSLKEIIEFHDKVKNLIEDARNDGSDEFKREQFENGKKQKDIFKQACDMVDSFIKNIDAAMQERDSVQSIRMTKKQLDWMVNEEYSRSRIESNPFLMSLISTTNGNMIIDKDVIDDAGNRLDGMLQQRNNINRVELSNIQKNLKNALSKQKKELTRIYR